MKLSDVDIRRRLAEGSLAIDPPPADKMIGAMSVDLQLGHSFRVFAAGRAPFIDLAPPPGTPENDVDALMIEVILEDDQPFYLHPGDFALGVTQQRITLPNDLGGRLDGRSSLARLGLMVHATAHTIDPGWDGCIVLEFFNCGPLPLALRPGMRICAVAFETLQTPTTRPYSRRKDAKYKEQNAPLSSRILDERP